jgi:DNA-binding MarR family transcriptional regulator
MRGTFMEDNIVLSKENIDLTRLINILNKAEYNLLNQKFRALNISHVQALIIIYLFNNDKETFQKDLEKEFGVSTPTMTQSIKSMTKKELIKKDRSKKDKRYYALLLTDKGKMLYPKCMAIYTEIESLLDSAFSKSEKANFIKSMKKLINIVQNYN